MDKRIDVINGLRGIAILGVVWHHLAWKSVNSSNFWRIQLGGFTLHPVRILGNGWLGVSLFFILSGFVLYLPYAAGHRNFATKSSWSEFWIRRSKRLLPLYYLSLLVFATILEFVRPREHSIGELLLYLTVTFNFTSDTFFPPYNMVLWSLGLEFWFSVLFPFLVVLSKRIGLGRLVAMTMVGSFIVRAVGSQIQFGVENLYLNWVKDSLPGRLDDFCVGMMLAQCYVNPPRVISRLISTALPIAGISMLLLVCTMWSCVVAGSLPLYVRAFLNIGFQAGAVAAILPLLYIRSWWNVILSAPALQLVGMMCFSIYIWHAQLISIVYRKSILSGFPGLAVYISSLLVISALSYRFIEFGSVRDWRTLFLLKPKSVA